jgi:uncharacterized membrane protein YbaN (DUF454 family)
MSLSAMRKATAVGVAETMASDRTMVGVPMIVSTAATEPRTGQGPQGKSQARVEFGMVGWIECHDQSGVVVIHDPRLFRPGQEPFCDELVKVAVERHQAILAEICLASSLCRLGFEPGRFDQTELANRVTAAVRAATPAVRHGSQAPRNPRQSWTTLTAFATDAGASIWERHEDQPGLVTLFNRAFESATAAIDEPEAPAGSMRLVDLASAGGCLLLAVAGIIVPGIPTLPFLALTGHFAVRLSPRLRRFLMREPWFAALLTESEGLECLRRLDRQAILKLVAITVLAVAAFLIIHPPLPVVLGLELGLMALVYFRKHGQPDPIELRLAA